MYSPKFDMVKHYFDIGFWDEEWVRNAVVKSWITADEYMEITGQPYL